MVDHTKALQRISKAKTSLILGHPFVGTIALNMPTRIDETIPTACTNGKEIRYNPAFVASLSDAELTFLVAHECMHPMLEHNYRRGGRNPLRWNKAADYAINELLIQEGIGTFIKGGLHNTALYTAGKGIAEAIYDLLPEEDNAAGGGASPNGSGGAGSPGSIGGTGVDLEDATGSAAEVAQAQAEMKVKVAQAAQAAKMAGKLSQRMRELVDQVLQPKVDWRAVLRTFVEKCRDDSRTWSRFNRRFLPQGLYLPSVSGERMGTIVVACDCSGSVSAQVIAEFAAEIRAIHQDTKPAALHVVYFDSEVLHRDDYTPEDVPEIIRHGGGGTAFSPIFKHVEAEGLNPVACVVLTDLICSDFGQQPDYPVLWVSTELDQAPWGQVIKM